MQSAARVHPDDTIDLTDRALLHRLLRLARLLEAGEHAEPFLPTPPVSQAASDPAMSLQAAFRQASASHTPRGAYSPVRTEYDYDDDDNIYDNITNEAGSQNAHSRDPSATDTHPHVPSALSTDTGSKARDGPDQRTSEIRPTCHVTPCMERETTQPLPAKTRPHAVAEQRYRSSMNEKLRRLHSAIPASGQFSMHGKQVAGGDCAAEQTCKSKSAVLENAVFYINSLLESHRKLDHDTREIEQQVRQWLLDFNDDSDNDSTRGSAAPSSTSPQLPQ